jgi:hypothetical protein
VSAHPKSRGLGLFDSAQFSDLFKELWTFGEKGHKMPDIQIRVRKMNP